MGEERLIIAMMMRMMMKEERKGEGRGGYMEKKQDGFINLQPRKRQGK